MKKKIRDYSLVKRDPIIERTEPERKVITGDRDIDYSCFKKSAAEREKLRLAKLGITLQKKKSRPGKEQRLRRALKRQMP